MITMTWGRTDGVVGAGAGGPGLAWGLVRGRAVVVEEDLGRVTAGVVRVSADVEDAAAGEIVEVGGSEDDDVGVSASARVAAGGDGGVLPIEPERYSDPAMTISTTSVKAPTLPQAEARRRW